MVEINCVIVLNSINFGDLDTELWEKFEWINRNES